MSSDIKNEMLPDIRRTLTMEAPIERVWKAVSTSEGLASWLMPNTFKAQMGFEFTMQAQPMGDWDGVVHCVVKELDPPRRIGFSWNGNRMSHYVSFELKALEKDKTVFELVHSGWTAGAEMLRQIMYDGWGYLTEGLQKKLGDKDGGYLS